MKLRIAHLSDLHVGEANRGLDMCPHELSSAQKSGRSSDYIAALEALVSSKEFTDGGPIDMLCVTGDISNKAHAEEFELTDRALKRIAAAMRVGEDRVFFTPGNHDVHWPVMKLEPQSFWAEFRYAPLLKEGLTFHGRASASDTGSIDKPPYFLAWQQNDALVVSINSAAYDGPSDDLHPGEVRQETVDALRDYLASQQLNTAQLRMCLLHHHPIHYSEVIPAGRDQTIIVNAENLLTVLSQHRFDLILHGHKHQPRLRTHLIDNGHPFVTLCAGSFSAILSPLHFDGMSNLFHVVNVDGRDSATGGITGSVESWTHTARGRWEPSHDMRGIGALESFGSSATVQQVSAEVLQAVSTRMQTHSFCRWEDVLALRPALEHVKSSLAHEALRTAATTLSLDMVGEGASAQRHWAVFRRSSDGN